MPQTRLPYCGAPPVPEMIGSRWNLDPILIIGLLVVLTFYGLGSRRAENPAWRNGSFFMGWSLVAVALVSPLCALSVALFSGRVGQHMLLTTLAAPLVVLGRPWRAIQAAFPGIARTPPKAERTASPLWAAAAFALTLWVWHAPGPYAATFESNAVYWLMHLTLFGSALWLWSELLDGGDRAFAARVGALAITSVQMGLLGALVTFAPHALYAPHLATTWPWGLSPLEDQQLGGSIMWVPSGLLFVAGLSASFVIMLRRAELRSHRLSV